MCPEADEGAGLRILACPSLFHFYTPLRQNPRMRFCRMRQPVLKQDPETFRLPVCLYWQNCHDSYFYLAEAKSADAVLPNAAAGASAPMLEFESPASAGLSNLYPVPRFLRHPREKRPNGLSPGSGHWCRRHQCQFESDTSVLLSNLYLAEAECGSRCFSTDAAV